MTLAEGWRLGDFDSRTPLWWEITNDRGEPAHILLTPVALVTLVDAHLVGGFKVSSSVARSWMPCKGVYFVESPDGTAAVTYRLMGPGEHERSVSATAAGPGRAERVQTAAIAVQRDRTASALAKLADEIAAMKRRAGVA